MEEPMSTQEQQLTQFLAELPAQCNYEYTSEASQKLLRSLFWSLVGGNDDYLRLLFPDGQMPDDPKLSDAQGAVEGAEYTEAARGKRCGHIFKAGEASYMCRTCGTDDTCCLCARCFDSTDHEGHMVRMHISIGNSGCCDCGDDEAWNRPLICTIHSDMHKGEDKGKGKEQQGLPENLMGSVQMTIARVLDYICDVISCSPEQLRQPKTRESVLKDEEMSRLSSKYYQTNAEPCDQFALVLWNDEKHTVQEVQHQIARACEKKLKVALQDAWDTDVVGRSILKTSDNIDQLLHMAKTIEAIRITVTIRSARDTFREQMCGTLVEWLSDIAGCAIGHDSHILRQIMCEEMMNPWRRGSLAAHIDGLIDDEEEDDQEIERKYQRHSNNPRFLMALQFAAARGPGAQFELVEDSNDEDDDDDEVDDDDDIIDDASNFEDSESVFLGNAEDDDVMMVDTRGDGADVNMSWQSDQALEEDEATMAGYPPPPPPPPAAAGRAGPARDRDATPSDSDTAAEPLIAPNLHKANADIPKTPGRSEKVAPRPGRYWMETPEAYTHTKVEHPAEDVFKRVRLDWLLLFDLRMWKKVRIDLRSLYISTVVQVPEFKRLLALRFSSLYTILAQLYLVGDREPDHSIINLSLQMLTTPSITAEVVERGNFLSCLFAILYTFLTTRQVGHPWDVSPDTVLSFDSGSVTNRRMYHFYQDLRYLFTSPHVQERIRCDSRYLIQFLDLVKLHQGIGANLRAVVEHVEYEADSWITTSLVTRQINMQARALAESFRNCAPDELPYLQRAVRVTAKTVILSSIGAERHRFKQNEIRDEVSFKTVDDFEFTDARYFQIVKFTVEKEHISFHHALHYTLSWLLECGRSLPALAVRELLSFTAPELRSKPRTMGKIILPKEQLSAEDYLMAVFDFPLRVCAWLAQIKANMWVRNGISLRHQASTYRGVGQRDVSHHRDIFLLQTALVICNPDRVLATIIDRFHMESWVKGLYEIRVEAQDDSQHLDVVEDMIHLLIVLLSDRNSLIAPEDESNPRLLAIRRDIIHVLCFKPLSFNEICSKLPEKYQEQEEFHEILNDLATFKPPEGVSDVGTFELRPEFIEDIDPYIAHYNKNQREEAETAYRKKMAKKTGQPIEDIVYEPRPRPIPSGLFKDLASFTSHGMFAQIIYYAVLYPLVAPKLTPSIPSTRTETFLQVVLHLILIAVHEDNASEDAVTETAQQPFIHTALSRVGRTNFMAQYAQSRTIASLLHVMSTKEEFKSSHPKIALVLKRMKQKRPREFETAFQHIGIEVDRINTASPAVASAEEDRERKKKAALSRQAKVMAQFQQQQKSFMENQTSIDWGSDLEDEEEEEPSGDKKHTWKYPTGTCILCQEEADERRLYGTFALITESHILRQTDFQDPDLIREALHTPCNLDRSAEDIRPFGIARENRKVVEKVNSDGQSFPAERQTIGKGFPSKLSRKGPVAVGCGHIMHFHCFETYYDATRRRHTHQIARHHPEDVMRKEFVCPLCKALGNAFLPIVWKGIEESFPGCLQPSVDFDTSLMREMAFPLWQHSMSTRNIAPLQYTELQSPSFSGSLLEPMMRAWLSEMALKPETSMKDEPTDEPSGSSSRDAPTFESRAGPSAAADATPRAEMPVMTTTSTSRDLWTAYSRLNETLEMNAPYPSAYALQHKSTSKLCGSDVLAQIVGFTISAVEIQQRGTEAQLGMTLLERISDQTLTHLRVVAETASSYIACGASHRSSAQHTSSEFRKDAARQHCQLFMARYLEEYAPLDMYTPLLGLDPFIFLVECSYSLAPTRQIDIAHLLKLCYLAEITKVVYHMGRSIPFGQWLHALQHRSTDDPAMNNFAEFGLQVTHQRVAFQAEVLPGAMDGTDGSNEGFKQPGVDTLEGWYNFVKKYALAFLRKSLIFMNVRYGVNFNSHTSAVPEADELDRLTEALRVPAFDEMCASLTPNAGACGWPESIQDIVQAWIKHQVVAPQQHYALDLPKSAMVSHPGIFELVGLPETYDTLIEEATRRRCPTTGKDLTDPVICLFCGEIFCSQGTCCQKASDTEQTTLGGAQQHVRK